jgi:prepilin-type N-terminal cleavage/methylation domain-containing protein
MNARMTLIRNRRGFTLIEVIITLSIFILLAAAVFGIFTATLESVAGLQDNQNQGDEVEALGAFLKKTFIDLPPEATIVSYHRDSVPFKVSGLIWGSHDNLHALDTQLQPNGFYTLRTASYTPPATTPPEPLSTFQRQILTDDPSLFWRPLVRDIRSADWKFRTFGSPQWQDQTAGPKPALAEFAMQLAGANAVITDDFWIPPTQPAGNPVIAAAAGNGSSP